MMQAVVTEQADVVVNLDEESSHQRLSQPQAPRDSVTPPVTTPRDIQQTRSNMLLVMTGLFLVTLGVLLYVVLTK